MRNQVCRLPGAGVVLLLAATLAVPTSVRAHGAEAAASQVRSWAAGAANCGTGCPCAGGPQTTRQVPRRLQAPTLDASPSASIALGGSGVLGLLRAVFRMRVTRRTRRDASSRRLAERVARVPAPTTDRHAAPRAAPTYPAFADGDAAAIPGRSPLSDAYDQWRSDRESRPSAGEPPRGTPLTSSEDWARHLGLAPASARTGGDDGPGDELVAVVEGLAEQVNSRQEHLLTDVSLLVNAAAGRLSEHWRYFSHDPEIRRRRFDPAFVWAAAWLAVRRGDIDHQHQLVITALDYCRLFSLDEGVARYAVAAIEGCRRRLEVAPTGPVYGREADAAWRWDASNRDLDPRHIG